MRLILTSVAAAALLATGLAGEAFAHGGSYRGPAGEVPPDSREPSDPPPPPEGGGPGTPGGEDPGGPTTGGGDVGGPGTGDGGDGPSTGGGGSGPPPQGGGGGGPTTGGTGKKLGGNKGPGYEDWTFWWNFNKDEILGVKALIKAAQRGAPTGSGAHAIGQRGTGKESRTATDTAIQTNIVPALRLLMDEKDLNFDIQSAAALALAKIGDATIVDRLKEMARNEGKDKVNKVVEESAALAFGLLQRDTPEVREFLIEMVQDKSRNSSFVRPFAAVSLGLLGTENDKDGLVPKALISVVNGSESKVDVKPTCLLALGLLGNDSQCETLLGMLRTAKTADGATELEDTEMAFVIQALGKIGRIGLDKPGEETAILDAVLGIADPKSKIDEKNIKRSAAIALGLLAKSTDTKTQAKIVKSLKVVVDESKDDQERHFALVSLGRMASAAGVDKEMRADVVKTLKFYLEKGKQHTPTFAAMGLGLVGRRMLDAHEPVDEESIRAPIRKGFAETKDPRSRGAFAIASGLTRDPRAVKDLIKVLENSKDDSKLRSYCALALGMIGDDSAKAAIHGVLQNDSDRELRVQTAVATGLMNDPTVIPDLVKILTSGEDSQYILGSVALALGQIGDERAIEPLLEIVRDEKKFPDLTRALATVALGQIGDRRDVPTLARVATDINYRAHVPAITELLTIL